MVLFPIPWEQTYLEVKRHRLSHSQLFIMNPTESEIEDEVNSIKPVNRKSEIETNFQCFNAEPRTLNVEPPAGQGGDYGK